jgi:hypothetical protein
VQLKILTKEIINAVNNLENIIRGVNAKAAHGTKVASTRLSQVIHAAFIPHGDFQYDPVCETDLRPILLY